LENDSCGIVEYRFDSLSCIITTLLILAENELLSPLSILITEPRPLGRIVRIFLFASSLQRMSAFVCVLWLS